MFELIDQIIINVGLIWFAWQVVSIISRHDPIEY